MRVKRLDGTTHDVPWDEATRMLLEDLDELLRATNLRAIAEAAAIMAAEHEIGLIPDWDNLLDALHQAGYTEERCAELLGERFAHLVDAATTAERAGEDE